MKHSGFVIVAGIVVFGAVAAGSWNIMQRGRAMMPSAVSVSDWESAPVGSRRSLVAQIDSAGPGGTVTAHLLARESDTRYRTTGTTLKAEVPQHVRFIMGAPSDIRSGTVLQLDGTIGPGHVLRTKQLVVLNGYVQVAR